MKDLDRFLGQLNEPDIALIEGQEYHHLFHVLKHRPGDEVVVLDGQGWAARGKITTCARDHASLQILETLPQGDAPWPITIACVPPKGERFGFMIEALTALGVDHIILLQSELSRVPAHKDLLKKAKAVSCQALKQCHRLQQPQIQSQTLSELNPDRSVLLSPRAPQDLPSLLKEVPFQEACTLVIGPEAGFSSEEESRFSYQAQLATHVLRIEHAALAAATLSSHHFFKRSQSENKASNC